LQGQTVLARIAERAETMRFWRGMIKSRIFGVVILIVLVAASVLALRTNRTPDFTVNAADIHEILTEFLAAEIEEILIACDGITGAKVVLNAPYAYNVFAPRTPASATVQLSGPDLTITHGRAAAQIVSRCVQGLDIDNIVVKDAANMSILFDSE
jgi:hypothetical protein